MKTPPKFRHRVFHSWRHLRIELPFHEPVAFEIAKLLCQHALADFRNQAAEVVVYTFYMGWSWNIVNFYVPMLMVSQIMIIYYLFTRPETAGEITRNRSGIAAGPVEG